ncbi:MAG: hypothetical protein GTO02_19020, partial [Candidatus Dadabacteria bacterium]|nr:hypothetical protein [Candidatus Dadabacteria bacterium]
MDIEFEDPQIDNESIVSKIPVCKENVERYMAQSIDIDNLEAEYKQALYNVNQIVDRDVRARELL